MLTTLLLTLSTALTSTSSGTGIMLLYWRGVGKLTGYSKIRSHQITETKKYYSKCMKRYWDVIASDVLNSNVAGENRKNSNHNRNEHIGTIVRRRQERSTVLLVSTIIFSLIIYNLRYKISYLKS